MNTNGLSLYNVATSLDLDALTSVNNNPKQQEEDEDESDGDEEEMQQRNAELQDLLTNAFDDLIEEDETDLEESHEGGTLHSNYQQSNQSGDISGTQFSSKKKVEFNGDSLYSPLHPGETADLSETQYRSVNDRIMNNSSSVKSNSQQQNPKKHSVRFSPMDDQTMDSYKPQWKYNGSGDSREQHYLSSGLNSEAELEILYAARGSEINKLTSEVHQLHHKTAILEGEKNGFKVTLETNERMLRESREENQCLKDELHSLNQRIDSLTNINQNLTNKLEAAENNTVSLERQILELNMFQANHRDANRQEVLLNGIKARYENDLKIHRDELNRLRSELDNKNESLSHMERKLRDVTEMHERTLTERAANLQEFNRALDQQRQLREQRDTLTSATLLDQLSKAQEEIDRLKMERISQNLSDSMTQMRIGAHKDHRDTKQTERIINNLEQRLKSSESTAQQLEETIRQLENEKKKFNNELESVAEMVKKHASEKELFSTELSNVKELYLNVCREKDAIEDQLTKLSVERSELENERKNLLKDLEEANLHMEENLNRHKAMLEANCDAKMADCIREAVARARLEWLKEKSNGQVEDLVHVEKSLGELQCLRETMDALRHERDVLQNELMRRQQQLKLERHLLREKFAIEKEILIKEWQAKVNSASETAVANKSDGQQTSQPSGKTLISATAEAMARLRQQCEEEKLSIISNYEKQIIDLQSYNSSRSQTPQLSTPLWNGQSAQGSDDWRLELSKLKMALRNIQQVPDDTLINLDKVIQKIETSSRRDHTTIREQSDKYKQLKRRVRDYQKYVHEKLAKYKAERQQSEEYCRQVISELLNKVSLELQKVEHDRRNANSAGPLPTQPTPTTLANGLHSEPKSTFAQSIDELTGAVNRYVSGLTNFTSTK